MRENKLNIGSLKSMGGRLGRIPILGLVFLLCIGAGLFSGHLIKTNINSADAASDNIIVSDNYQVSVIDQSTSGQTLTRSSTVTVRDSSINAGYTLTATLSQNIPTGASVTIASASSTLCPLATPCTLSPDTPTDIFENHKNNALTAVEDTVEWTVQIALPPNLPKGHYPLDINYDQEAKAVSPMQSITNATCSTDRSIAYDARDGQIYYIQKIENSGGTGKHLCWMESNLRYAGDGKWSDTWGWPDDRYATTVANAANTANANDNTRPLTAIYVGNSSSSTLAHFMDPGGSTDYTNTSTAGGFYGYLYNFCAGMGGQATACNTSSSSVASLTTSICPSGWRMPTGGSGGEFVYLNSAINGGSTSSDAGFINNWLIVRAGYYASFSGYAVSYTLAGQGTYGSYLTATAFGGLYAYNFLAASTHTGSTSTSQDTYKNIPRAVRCVL